MPRRGRFHWNFFPGHFRGMRFGPMFRMGGPPFSWRRRIPREDELELLKEYLEELTEMQKDLEEEINEVKTRIEELQNKK